MVPSFPNVVPGIDVTAAGYYENTRIAFEKVADIMSELQPETIVLVSSRAVVYTDYFHMSPGNAAIGTLQEFGAGNIKLLEEYAPKMVKEIGKCAKKLGIPAGTLGEKSRELDYGSVVPLHFIRKKYRGGKVVRMGVSQLSYMDHYKMGQAVQAAAERLASKTVVIASGNLSYKLEGSCYGYSAEGPFYDYKIVDACSRGAFGEILDLDEDFCTRAGEDGHRTFLVMMGAMDGLNVYGRKLSYDEYFGAGYGICSFVTGDKNINRKFIEKPENDE
mgnify:CR=1 FL=1